MLTLKKSLAMPGTTGIYGGEVRVLLNILQLIHLHPLIFHDSDSIFLNRIPLNKFPWYF